MSKTMAEEMKKKLDLDIARLMKYKDLLDKEHSNE